MAGIIKSPDTSKLLIDGERAKKLYVGGEVKWAEPPKSILRGELISPTDDILFVGSSALSGLAGWTWHQTGTHEFHRVLRPTYTGGNTFNSQGRTTPGMAYAISLGGNGLGVIWNNANNGNYAGHDPLTNADLFDVMVIGPQDIGPRGLNYLIPNAGPYSGPRTYNGPHTVAGDGVGESYSQLEAAWRFVKAGAEAGIRKFYLFGNPPRYFQENFAPDDTEYYDTHMATYEAVRDSWDYMQDWLNAALEEGGYDAQVTMIPAHTLMYNIANDSANYPASLRGYGYLHAMVNNVLTDDPLTSDEPRHYYMMNAYAGYAYNLLFAAIAYNVDPMNQPEYDDHYWTVPSDLALYFKQKVIELLQEDPRAGMNREPIRYQRPSLIETRDTVADIVGDKLIVHKDDSVTWAELEHVIPATELREVWMYVDVDVINHVIVRNDLAVFSNTSGQIMRIYHEMGAHFLDSVAIGHDNQSIAGNPNQSGGVNRNNVNRGGNLTRANILVRMVIHSDETIKFGKHDVGNYALTQSVVVNNENVPAADPYGNSQRFPATGGQPEPAVYPPNNFTLLEFNEPTEDIHVLEFMAFNEQLSDQERISLDRYLSDKYGYAFIEPIIGDTNPPEPAPEEPTEPTEPDAPSTPTFGFIGSDQATVSWSEPSANGSPITSYRLQFREEDEASTDRTGVSSPYVLEDLDSDTPYEVRVAAQNAVGWSDWSSWGLFYTDEFLAPQMRTASNNSTTTIHSGHSLTDAYLKGGGWPGYIIQMSGDIGVPNSFEKHVASTIPGSPMHWRWDHPVDDTRPGNPSADAREDIGDFTTLMITEGGPPPRIIQSESMLQSIDYFCRFAANTIENGAGNEVILWSIWPSLFGPGASPENQTPSGDWAGYTFRTGCDEYYRSFKYMADYTSWKMRQLYPSLPSDWRVWLIPGDRWMARVYDDIQNGLVPTITEIDDFFADDIHTDERASYGLSCLVMTCLYQIDISEENNFIIPDGMDSNLVSYFWQIAWEIANEYETTGMGGTQGISREWQPSDGDLMPNWTLADPNTDPIPDPGPEPGDLPEFVFTASADDLTDLTGMTGTQPTVEDGVLKFEGGEALDGDLILDDRYLVITIMIPGTLPQGRRPAIVGFRAIDTPGWDANGPIYAVYNGYFGVFGIDLAGGGEAMSASASADTWYTLEIWTDAEGMHGLVDGVDSLSVSGEIPETIVVRLFPELALSCHVAAIGICDHVPTPEERAAARVWAQGLIPE